GDLGGWVFASSGNSRAALDERGVYDGARAVVIDCPTMADVALVTGSALAMPVPACGTISFWTRGTVKGALTAVASASSGARESVLGAVRLSNVDAGNWAQCSIPIASFAQLDRPKLRVELQGLSGTLWLDRFTVEAKAAPKTGEPVVNGPGVTLLQNDVGSFVISGADSAASLNVRTGLLGQPDARAMLSDVNVKPRRVATQCRVLKAGGGEVQGETIAMEAPPAVNRVPGGVELVWRVKKAAPVLSLSATHTKLTLADERGNIVDVSNPSAASVSGIMEIGFGELTASFMAPCTVEFGDAVGESIDVNVVPSGAEVIVLRVYHYSPAYARTLANVTAGMESLFAQRRMSDAREYAVFLAGVKAAAYSEFAGEGRKKRQLIDDGLNALWLKADAAMLRARSSKDAEAAKEAKLTLGQIMRDYYLDQRVESAKTLHAEMVELENLLRKGVDPVQVDTTGLRGKKPERPRSDEIFKLDSERAATLLASARESYASGNWLCAFMFADNVRWNYHYTDSATEAEQLATTIEQAWNDAETRDGWIVAEGVKAQKYESDGALGNALEVLRGILARYPRCAQAPVVLRKIRELEELGK
ncbi:MAG: hypothetical protein L6Q71_11160, partial [Planctomycetes bacterium]|nr:hypothetical protein [Planctomycetota bacterium]